MNRWIDAFRRGARAGAVATTPMTMVMGAARTLGLLGEPPPRKIAHEVLDFFGLSKSSAKKDIVAFASHYGFGAGVGGLYGVLRETGYLPSGRLSGACYGTAIWAGSYFGWVPAITGMPRPQNDRPLRPWAMVIAHWVYGIALDARFERTRRAA